MIKYAGALAFSLFGIVVITAALLSAEISGGLEDPDC